MTQKYAFISYVREDHRAARRLADDLTARGVEVWIDYKSLVPGDRWPDKIRDAIRSGSLFVALFTREYAFRDKTYMNEELTFAIGELRQRPKDRRWFVPVVVDGGSHVPDWSIGPGETLRHLHWLDLSDGWDPAVDVISGLLANESPEAAPSWEVISRQIAEYSPTKLQESLNRGAIPVPDYRFEEALFSVARSCRQSVASVSFDDLDLWSAAEPRSRRYQAEKNSALMRGFTLSRMVVMQKQKLLHATSKLQYLLVDHMFHRIGVAIVIAEHVAADRRHAGHEFAIFDGGAIVTVGGRESPWVLVSFDTHGVAPASDRLVQRQAWLYDWLTDYSVLTTGDFLASHDRVSNRRAAGESVVMVTPDDDVEECVERLNALLR